MRISWFLCFLGLCLTACNGSRSTLNVASLLNYNKEVPDHIIFLNFEITALNRLDGEKVTLTHAVSGSGRIRNLEGHVDDRNYIRVVKRYADGRETESAYQHPLFKQSEVSGAEGKISKVDQVLKEGILSIRLQEEKLLERIELLSVTPEKGTKKIYTLKFK